MDDLFDFAARSEPRLPELASGSTQIFSVSGLTRAIRDAIENGVGEVWVEGEITNHRAQASGHHYFALKDASAQLYCVLFARSAAGVLRRMAIADGQLVQCHGRVSVYEPRGQYQLIVSTMRAAGAGALHAKFEALKRKLEAEGLFDPARKKPIPTFPKTVLLITSPTGAAVRDMIHVLRRRAPFLRIVLWPVAVQGAAAPGEIAAALDDANRLSGHGGCPAFDAIIAGRGGGSIEDLWAFNEEAVARAIARSRIPVISAVGHETDFTIADFVADLRAPTPSAAAEVVAPDAAELRRALAATASAIRRAAASRFATAQLRVAGLRRAALFTEPQRRIARGRQALDASADAIRSALSRSFTAKRAALAAAAAILKARQPAAVLRAARERATALARRRSLATTLRFAAARNSLERTASLLRVLSPQATLDRGYAVLAKTDGTVIRTPSEAPPGTPLLATLAGGILRARSE